MDTMSLNEVYNGFSQWAKDYSSKLSGSARNKISHLILALDTAITQNQQTLDKDNINVCLETLHRLKNFTWPRCNDEHLLAFLDFLTSAEVAILFGVKIEKIYTEVGNMKRRRQGSGEFDSSIPEDPDKVMAMSEDDFNREMKLNVRLKALAIIKDKKVSQATVELIKQELITSRERKIENVGKMFNLFRKLLTWFTGDFLPAFTKRVAHVLQVPHERIQIIASEVLDDEYTILVREFKEIKIEPNIPLGNLIKKAKRRGKEKWTRKQEEQEEKLLKASSSTVPPPNENVESTSNSVSEEVVS